MTEHFSSRLMPGAGIVSSAEPPPETRQITRSSGPGTETSARMRRSRFVRQSNAPRRYKTARQMSENKEFALSHQKSSFSGSAVDSARTRWLASA